MPQPPDVVAAGAVVFRPGPQVLLVHRGKYDDWSFPKGKLDRGEHRVAAAVREVEEETGLRVRLGPPLPSQRYRTGERMKTVHYWTGRVVGNDDVEGHTVPGEIEAVAWLDVEAAADRLTYPRDRAILTEALEWRRRTQPLVVLRHGAARSRKTWRADDRLRPLLRRGREDVRRVTPILAAYDVQRVVSSSSTRCSESVAPYVEASGAGLELTDSLSERGATPKAVRRVVDDLLEAAGHRGAMLCTHRPVLPLVFDHLGLEDPHLETGEMLVVHLRKSDVVAVERHPR